MGRHQTEAAYLKSVLFWLQGHWSEPDPPRFYSLGEVEQASRHYSAGRTRAALNRRDADNRSARLLATPKVSKHGE
jgi:hypothetical protein